MAPPKVLVIGGGFAGVIFAQNTSAFADVTLVDPKAFLEITWATVRSVVNTAVAAKAVIQYEDLPKMGRVVNATVTRLTPKEAHLSNGEVLAFDYCAICTGSSYSDAFKSNVSLNRDQRLLELKSIGEEIKAAKNIVVIGGGPAGVEVAAEIVEAYAGKAVTLVHPRAALLSTLPPKAGAQAKKWLEAHGVKLLLNTTVESKPEGRGPATLTLSGGVQLAADLVLWCAGAKPITGFMNEDMAATVNDKAAIKVLPTLQVTGQPHMFALGDCNDVPETKKGYLAMEQAKLAAKSLKALVAGGSPKLGAWKPEMGMEMMLISMGSKDGICQMKTNVCSGCLPAGIKSKGLFVDKTRGDLRVK
ncbi:Apoptosis-inducing factor B [Tetrabaena socialis]|uniref:Apoptosis-inducing factor B n=1 Tax=Tetrabaena socialis TaxID=47790 RepID=A0A2J8AAL3_9CHLO|nr:Apoptosis-inducing factor B [Tetrabaena socialis]|eukprot:PNH09564.1 Apoptosis-inducing factor B [Tetrabaena socialis]